MQERKKKGKKLNNFTPRPLITMIDSCPKEANVGTILPLELLDL
jgi:hypothetical protein